MSFESALKLAKERASISFDLKDEQKTALRALYERKDVMCLLPTGFGKSVIFQLAPFLLDQTVSSGIALIIAPLNAIMKDQVLKLCRTGVSACYIDMDCEEGETFQLASGSTDSDNDTDLDDDGWETDEDEQHTDLDVIQVSVPISDLMIGKYNLIYAHPEALLSTTAGMSVCIAHHHVVGIKMSLPVPSVIKFQPGCTFWKCR